MMFHIIFIGNVGEQYQDTAHNIAWAISDEMDQSAVWDCDSWEHQGMVKSYVSNCMLGEHSITRYKPQTYINNSGTIFNGMDTVDPQSVIVVHDDIDLPFGQVRLSKNRGDGGHNGIKSITQHLRTKDFIRIRIGVCPSDWFGNSRKPRGSHAVQQYLVSRKLSSRYTKQYSTIAPLVSGIIKSIAMHGYQQTISRQ